MTKKGKFTLIISAITVVLWILFFITVNTATYLSLLYGAVICSIISVAMGFVCLIDKLKKQLSPYMMFGIINALIAVILAIWGVIDILTDTGFMAGLFGTLILCFVVPVPIVLIIIDVIVYFIKRK